MEKAYYLFCLARAELLPEFPIPGLNADDDLLKETWSDVSAVWCEVPLDEFSGPAAETRLQDLSWVGPKALRHAQVIQQVTQYSPVLPARFGTLFSSVESLKQLLKQNLQEIDEFLDRVTDKDEWAVKGSVSRAELREQLFSKTVAEQPEIFASLSQGMRYFKERQIRAEIEKQLGNWIRDTLNALVIPLTGCSADWRRREVVFQTQEGTDRETVVNWAFLVDRGHVEDFTARIDSANNEYNTQGLFLELSGPWPPYSFTPVLDSGTIT